MALRNSKKKYSEDLISYLIDRKITKLSKKLIYHNGFLRAELDETKIAHCLETILKHKRMGPL